MTEDEIYELQNWPKIQSDAYKLLQRTEFMNKYPTKAARAKVTKDTLQNLDKEWGLNDSKLSARPWTYEVSTSRS